VRSARPTSHTTDPRAAAAPAPVTIARQPRFLAFILVAAAILPYLPVLHGGFVFDDVLFTNSRLIHAPDGLRRIWCTTEALDYYPLTHSLRWLQWRLWGRDATGYHVLNVCLHAANVLLLWLVLQRLKLPGAWLAALLFAIHPVNAATVAWITEQKNTLSMLFGLMAALFYLRFDETNCWLWYGLSLAAFALALLSKTAILLLPIALLLCLWWRRCPLRPKDIFPTVPFFALSLIAAPVTIWFEYQRGLSGTRVLTASFLARLLTAGAALWFYLIKALLPVNLMVIYPKWRVAPAAWAWYVPDAALVAVFFLLWRNRAAWGRPLLFGLGYFTAMLLPVLGFFDQGFYRYSLVSDHWQYYSIAGITALVAAAAVAIARRIAPPARSLARAIGIALLLLLAFATWNRAAVYASSESLWRDALAKNPNAFVAYNNLGLIAQKRGLLPEAIDDYQQALRLDPDYPEARDNLGTALMQSGSITAAIDQYRQALRIKRDFAEAHNNLGIALARIGSFPEAIGHFMAVVQMEPDFAQARCNLGNALSQLGQIPDAIAQYHLALQSEPKLAQAHFLLAAAWEREGRTDDALGQYQQALQINPDYADAHNNLGSLFLRRNQLADAIDQYQLALRSKPDDPEAHYNLGLALARQGQWPDAISHWEQAVRLRPYYAQAHLALAAALEQAGRIPDAIRHYQDALRFNSGLVQARDALDRLHALP